MSLALAPAGGPCWKACLWSARKSEKQPPAPLITLLILGIVIHYVSFFLLQREKASACQSAVMGRPRFIACSVFWVSSVLVLVQPPRGAWGRRAARAWPGGQEGPANCVGSGAGAERLARLVLSPASVYVSTELSWPGTQDRHCVLGDSLAPNSAGNAGESGFQGHFRFYSSGKTFGVCLKVCSNPWPLVETASRWQGVGGPHSGLPSLAPMTPQTGSSPGGQGLIHLCVPTPEGCSVT